jgi:hypothetical protein
MVLASCMYTNFNSDFIVNGVRNVITRLLTTIPHPCLVGAGALTPLNFGTGCSFESTL